MGRVAVEAHAGGRAIRSPAERDDESPARIQPAPALQRSRVARGQGDVEVGVGGGQRCPLLRRQRLGRWSVEPGCEQAGVPPPGGRGTGDDGHVHGDAAVAQVGPESAVLVGPAAQFAVSLAIGVRVDEAGGPIVGGDGEFEGEVTPGAPLPGAVEPVWELPLAEAATREVDDLLGLGGEPREGGLSKHVLEGEKTAEQDDVPRRPAMPDVFDAEGAVEAAAVDAGVPETGRVSRKGILPSEAVLDEAVDEGVGGLRGAAVMFGEPDSALGITSFPGACSQAEVRPRRSHGSAVGALHRPRLPAEG